jgi:hypothetical protein
LGDAEGDDLGVCDPASRVLGPLRQEIVGGAENCRKEQVEVGIHRGLRFGGEGLITADFDLSMPFSLPTINATVPRNRLFERESVESFI